MYHTPVTKIVNMVRRSVRVGGGEREVTVISLNMFELGTKLGGGNGFGRVVLRDDVKTVFEVLNKLNVVRRKSMFNGFVFTGCGDDALCL